jgi:Amt family ammonium transporter
MGGVGDVHATLPQPLGAADTGALDHELGFNLSGHHLGFMGSSGFFLMTDEPAPGPVALLFLGQAALLIFAVAAALGAALERARLLPMLIYAFLIGVLLYPLLANWVWGGGWLAELGREFGLGHGLVDLAGAGVIHETAGALALAIALVLGPRHGRFAGGKTPGPIPGHHLPFVVLGAIVLLIALTATNAFAAAVSTPESGAATAAVNTLLAAAGGLALSFLHASWKWRKPGPALLSRGMLGGAVASCGGGALLDPWAAFLIGAVAGLLVQAVTAKLERSRVDDPAGTFAVHGAGGAWGLLAVGLFANNTAGDGLNGVPGLVRGLFFGGGARQMAAQLIGCLTGFAVVFVLGYVTLSLIKKIVGLRVDRAEEISGLDWPQLGAFGYQGETEDIS